MGANDPRGMANLDPRGMVDRIYVETTKHCYILSMLALGLLASEKKIFEVVLYKQMTPPPQTPGHGQFGPQR